MDLKEFFSKNRKVAIAFSGGADSSYLLYCAKKYASDVKAYYFKSSFQPNFELEDALKISEILGIELKIINADLSDKIDILRNDSLRCYYCKSNMLSLIIKEAALDGYKVIADGTNASDNEAERAGMRALKEKKIISPLKICGITKQEVYSLSTQEGLCTCNKPSYSCLATRIPTGTMITDKLLKKIENAEKLLMGLGLSDFRFRIIDENSAKIQLKKAQYDKAVSILEAIRENLKNDFSEINIDTEVFK